MSKFPKKRFWPFWVATNSMAQDFENAMSEGSPRSPLPKLLEFLRENIESLVVAILMALIIRHFVFEPFQIPTGSMATTLLGKHRMIECEHCQWDWPVSEKVSTASVRCVHCLQMNESRQYREWSGEKILANKMIYYFREPKRWETIVFRPPHQKHLNFIKRAIGLGGEEVLIQGGDIYIDDEISTKPPRIQDEVWIPVYSMEHDIEGTHFFKLSDGWSRHKKDDGFTGSYQYEDPGNRLTNTMEWFRHVGKQGGDEIIWSHLSYNSKDSFQRLYPVGDLKIDLELKVSGESGLFAVEIEDGLQTFRLELGQKNRVVHLSGLQEIGVYPLETRLLPDQKVKVSFENWDNFLAVTLDGRRVLEQNISLSREDNEEGAGTFRFTARDGDVSITDVKVFRDIYYTSGQGSSQKWTIPPGDVFALGDNSNGSNDSRSWGTIPRENLRGRPWLRLLHFDFPFTQTHWDWIKFGDVP